MAVRSPRPLRPPGRSGARHLHRPQGKPTGRGGKLTGWLDGLDLPEAIRPATPPDTATRFAVAAWNLMGGKLDWSALEVVAELLGITDLETLVLQLVAIRDRPRQE